MESRENADAPLAHIRRLAAEEHKLLELPVRDAPQDRRLKQVQVELDQCWDLLRQRRALLETGGNPADAQLRPPEVVERYLG